MGQARCADKVSVAAAGAVCRANTETAYFTAPEGSRYEGPAKEPWRVVQRALAAPLCICAVDMLNPVPQPKLNHGLGASNGASAPPLPARFVTSEPTWITTSSAKMFGMMGTAAASAAGVASFCWTYICATVQPT